MGGGGFENNRAWLTWRLEEPAREHMASMAHIFCNRDAAAREQNALQA